MNLAGIDVGTSGVKCCVYNEEGRIVASARRSYRYADTEEGYCLDGNQVWKSTKAVLKEAAHICGGEISGISVSSLGEACVLMDAENRILSPSILYNDRRGLEESRKFIETFGQNEIFQICGLTSNGTCSLEKLMWIRRHEPYYDKADKIFLYEDFITFCLTGERGISYSLASRTMGFDITAKKWWRDAFGLAGVDIEKMSVPQKPASLIGTVRKRLAAELGLKSRTAVFAGGHDHSCCTFGAGMLNKEISVNITGSGDTISYFLERPVKGPQIQRGGFCNQPYVLDGSFTTYGLCAMSGTMLRWFHNVFWQKSERDFYDTMEKLLPQCETEVIVFPGFSASGTPDFCLDTTGTIDGLTLKTSFAGIYKALMESVAFHIKMNREVLGRSARSVRTVGGGSNSDAWNQIKADVLDCEIQTLENKEAGTAGCAMLAGMGLGLYRDAAEASEVFVRIADRYYPDREKQKRYEEKYQRFNWLYSRKRKRMEEKDACK